MKSGIMACDGRLEMHATASVYLLDTSQKARLTKS